MPPRRRFDQSESTIRVNECGPNVYDTKDQGRLKLLSQHLLDCSASPKKTGGARIAAKRPFPHPPRAGLPEFLRIQLQGVGLPEFLRIQLQGARFSGARPSRHWA